MGEDGHPVARGETGHVPLERTLSPVRQALPMTDPREDTDEPNLRPGQRDEGDTGGMATRELAAHQKDDEQRDGAPATD
jgi:hypothetical protein